MQKRNKIVWRHQDDDKMYSQQLKHIALVLFNNDLLNLLVEASRADNVISWLKL